MKAPEREPQNGKRTSLRESVADTLGALNLLSERLRGLEGGQRIAASLQKVRRDILKTYPTLVWQNPSLTWKRPMTTIGVSKETKLRPVERGLEGEANGIKQTEPEQVQLENDVGARQNDEENILSFRQESNRTERSEGARLLDKGRMDASIISQASGTQIEASEYEKFPSGNLAHAEAQIYPFNNDGFPQTEMTEDSKLEKDLPEDLSLPADFEEEKIGDEYLDDDIVTGNNLDSTQMYFREIRKIPIQVEKHATWGTEIFVGELALKALSQLSKSPFLTPAQKEKTASVLGSKKGKFLLQRLNSRIESAQEKLKGDNYKDKYEDEEKAKRAKELDKEFLEMTLENGKLVNETLDNARAVEDEDEREILLKKFMDQQINFANRGQNSYDSLVEANQRLCVRIARKYLGRGLDLLDLINYGNFGLMIAAGEYDPRRKTEEGKPIKFSTYATWWIKQKIGRAITDYGSMIRLPVNVHTELNKARRDQERKLTESGQQSDLPDKLHNFLELRIVSSLDEPIDIAGNGKIKTLNDTMEASEQGPSVEELAEKNWLKDPVREILATLNNARQRKVLELRFGIPDGRSRTLEEVGRELGVTRERIRQIEAAALIKLRHPSRSKKLRSLLRVD